jgi:hypothetical protein
MSLDSFVIDFTLVHFSYIFSVFLMYKGEISNLRYFLYTFIFFYHGLMMTGVQDLN